MIFYSKQPETLLYAYSKGVLFDIYIGKILLCKSISINSFKTLINILKMKEVFQNYEHYAKWFSENLYLKKGVGDELLKMGLARLENNDTVGEPIRRIKKHDFLEKENQEGFIQIPDFN